MVSFVSYVLRFKNDDSALGDVARDIAMDTRINRRWGYTQLIVHLMRMNAVEAVYQILSDARVGYIVNQM
jgi:hypothetical protein